MGWGVLIRSWTSAGFVGSSWGLRKSAQPGLIQSGSRRVAWVSTPALNSHSCPSAGILCSVVCCSVNQGVWCGTRCISIQRGACWEAGCGAGGWRVQREPRVYTLDILPLRLLMHLHSGQHCVAYTLWNNVQRHYSCAHFLFPPQVKGRDCNHVCFLASTLPGNAPSPEWLG